MTKLSKKSILDNSSLFSNSYNIFDSISFLICLTCFVFVNVRGPKIIIILAQKSNLEFLPKSATSLITPTKDNYFTNDSIYEQFSRLFILIKYSDFFKKLDFRIDLVVDNATTHTKKHVDVNMFAMNINKSCPV